MHGDVGERAEVEEDLRALGMWRMYNADPEEEEERLAQL